MAGHLQFSEHYEADSKHALETQDGWKGSVKAATAAATELFKKDEQPNGNPSDVEAGIVEKDDNGKGEQEEEEMASMERLWQYNKPEGCYMVRLCNFRVSFVRPNYEHRTSFDTDHFVSLPRPLGQSVHSWLVLFLQLKVSSLDFSPPTFLLRTTSQQ